MNRLHGILALCVLSTLACNRIPGFGKKDGDDEGGTATGIGGNPRSKT